jgi:glycosyltransferase involved in cell wall biosynthesis
LGRIAAKSISRKIPVVHTYHGHLIYGYFAKYKSFIFTLIERSLAQFTDAAVCITKETQDSLLKLKIGRSLKWRVIRLGIPIGNLNKSSTKENSKIALLWVGRFTDIKDPFYAISVISELEEISPGKYKLQMVGGGELLEESKELASQLPVTFTGWLDNPFENLNHFDLLSFSFILFIHIFVSLFESFRFYFFLIIVRFLNLFLIYVNFINLYVFYP